MNVNERQSLSNTVDKSILILVTIVTSSSAQLILHNMGFCEEVYPLSNSNQGFIRAERESNWNLV